MFSHCTYRSAGRYAPEAACQFIEGAYEDIYA
jgi:hypothetical protein